MQINIGSKGFKLTDALRTHVERRLRFALGSTSSRMRIVRVRLADENGPRGGVDKRCTIEARIEGAAPVFIRQQDADLYVAIDRAADRAGRAVLRRLEKQIDERGTATVTDRGEFTAAFPDS